MISKSKQRKEIEDRLKDRFVEGFVPSVDVMPGWYPIITDLVDKLEVLDPDFKIQQIKEKFGGLRFYASFTQNAEECNALIVEAEREAYKTCDTCGSKQNVTTAPPDGKMGYIYTLCDFCRKRDGL